MHVAAMYPTTMPAKIGIRRSSPLPNSDTTTVVNRAIMANVQLLFAMLTPVPASDRPISIMTGPTTIGGNNLEMNPTPRSRTSRLINP